MLFLFAITCLLPNELDYELKPRAITYLPNNLRSVTDAAAFGQGIFVVDNSGNQVLRFNHDLEFVGRFGEEGEGPGSLRPPMKVATSAERLVVHDPRGFNFFNRIGMYSHTVRFPLRIMDFLLFQDRLYLIVNDPNSNFMGLILDTQGVEVGRFAEKQGYASLDRDEKRRYDRSGYFNDAALLKDGTHIYVVHKRFAHIARYDASGKLLAQSKGFFGLNSRNLNYKNKQLLTRERVRKMRVTPTYAAEMLESYDLWSQAAMGDGMIYLVGETHFPIDDDLSTTPSVMVRVVDAASLKLKKMINTEIPTDLDGRKGIQIKAATGLNYRQSRGLMLFVSNQGDVRGLMLQRR